jgi:hypothetical protein
MGAAAAKAVESKERLRAVPRAEVKRLQHRPSTPRRRDKQRGGLLRREAAGDERLRPSDGEGESFLDEKRREVADDAILCASIAPGFQRSSSGCTHA